MRKVLIKLCLLLVIVAAQSGAEEGKTSYLPPYVPQTVLSPSVEAFMNGSANTQDVMVRKTYNYDALGRILPANKNKLGSIAIPYNEKMKVVVVYLDIPEYEGEDVNGEYINEGGNRIYKLNGEDVSEKEYFKSIERKRSDDLIGYTAEMTAKELRNLVSTSTRPLYIDEYVPAQDAATYSSILDTSLVTGWAHSNGYKGNGIGVMFAEGGCPKTSLINTSNFTQNSGCNQGITWHATATTRVFQTTAPESKLFEYNVGYYPSPTSTTPSLEVAFFPISTYNDSSYKAIDAAMDNYTYTHGVIAVTAAGNKSSSTGTFHVSSPGKSVNAITVGGVYPFSNLYESFSRWKNSEVQNQKPEVANYDAFHFPNDPSFTDDNGVTYNGFIGGTSAAAAYTAGMLADVLQQHPFFEGHPEMAKALLITGSTKTIPNASSHDQDNNSLAAEAMPLYRSIGWNTRSRYWSSSNSGSFVNDTITFTESNITSGKRYRIAISWLTPGAYVQQNKTLSQDIDLYVMQNGNTIACSTSGNNPFEVVDFTTSSASDLTIIIKRYANSGSGKVALGYNLWHE